MLELLVAVLLHPAVPLGRFFGGEPALDRLRLALGGAFLRLHSPFGQRIDHAGRRIENAIEFVLVHHHQFTELT